MRFLLGICTTGFLAIGSLSAQAATLEYDFPVLVQDGGTGQNEIRATFLEVLRPLTLESLTVDLALDQTVDINATWTIYNSNANDDVLTAVTSVDAGFSFSGERRESQLVTTQIDATLDIGFYLFALQTDAPLFYTYYHEPSLPDGSLPFVTDDGAFRVLNGGIINFDASDPSIIRGNQSLPTISAEYDLTDVPSVPLPAGGVLLLSALGAGVAAGRRRKRRPS